MIIVIAVAWGFVLLAFAAIYFIEWRHDQRTRRWLEEERVFVPHEWEWPERDKVR